MAHTYHLYGQAVACARSLSYHVHPTTAAPALRVGPLPPPGVPSAFWARATLVSQEADAFGPTVTIYRHDDGARHVLRFEGGADFLLEPDAIRYYLLDPTLDYAIEAWLLGTVFSLWNELRGVPALHAAAVAMDGQALGLLATNKGGKSSLAAALMQAGHPLLTDDILMVDATGPVVMGRPSYPQMRMWPDQARHFLGPSVAEALPQVVPHLPKRRVVVGEGGFGRFRTQAAPIAHLVVPERRGPATEIDIQPLAPSAALIEVLRHSFLPNTVARLGLSPRRLPVLSALARQVRVARLVYPTGVEHLPRVAEALHRWATGPARVPSRA